MSKISGGRKAVYYSGIIIAVLGSVLFISVFFAASGLTDGMSAGPFLGKLGLPFGRAATGIVLIPVGFALMNIGARGAAGSGVVLDPDRATEDLKPFNEAKGRMINDVVDNIDAVQRITEPEKIRESEIKVRCRGCGALNDEDAKYCKSCGDKL